MNCAHLEEHIDSPEAGALALVASIIVGAVEDVRLYLTNPVFGAGGTNHLHAAGMTRVRALNAKRAAQFLNGPECQELCTVLKSCGCTVPMKRFFRELNDLKRERRSRADGE